MDLPLPAPSVVTLRILVAISFWSGLSTPLLGQDITFERHIRPILREYCFDCHGGTEKLEGSLDLRLVRFMMRGGDSGTTLHVGDPKASLLIQRIESGEMPPGEKRVAPEKLATLQKWIETGCKTERAEPEQIGPGIPITQEDREYWAFRPIQRPPIPPSSPENRVRTSIDAFVLNKMPAGLGFSADADRATLIRRLYFDLLGVPPTYEELERWKSSAEANWYEQLIDRLLESPAYGERWGRHWLDIAGYADSEGQTIQDAVRSWAWKYRDYVIRSLNANKPMNQFIVEQLAGDELAGPKVGEWTEQQIELLTATGYLTMAADGTGSGDNSPEARNKVIADTMKIVSSSLLGLSVGCAQCHDHRYDPISQRDYFAMRAVFEPALDWQQWRTPVGRQISLYTQADHAKAAEIEAEVKKIVEQRDAAQKVYMAEALDKELAKYEEPLRGELRVAYETVEKDRTDEQKSLLKKYPSVNITPGVLYQYLPKAAEELKKFAASIDELRAKKKPEEFLRAMTEVPDRIPDTFLFHRGEHQQPKQKVLPSDLSIAAAEGEVPLFAERDPNLPTSGRRLAYARWLTSGKHPLVARVLVNRIWLHHFGQAIVPTPSEFGKLGIAPTHPELLDWLADEFMRSGWDLKQLHRLVLTSTVWRQSSVADPSKVALDPDNIHYSRKSIQRLDAEILRDRMLASAGTLESTLFGPPVAIKADETGQVIVDGQQKRRSLYIQSRRTQPVAMLQSFDAPVMDVNCERRPVSTVATQSLILMNGEFTLHQAGLLADRVIRESQSLEPRSIEGLPKLPEPQAPEWTYGYGLWDHSLGRLQEYRELPHWTGTEWQGSAQRPDPSIGWVILNANGGHPGGKYAAVRKWRAPSDGRLKITGKLQHGSEGGDGVRGTVVSGRSGKLGEWIAFHNGSPTSIDLVEVRAGEGIDFVVDCQASENADSFEWKVKIEYIGSTNERIRDSVADFHGPVTADSFSRLPTQLEYAWRLVFSRPPSQEEMVEILQYASSQLSELQRDPRGVLSGSSPSKQVLVNFCHTLMNSNEFVYVD